MPRPTTTRQPRARRGLTIIELVVALSVLTVGVLALAASARSVASLRHAGAERLVQLDALSASAESLRASPCEALVDGASSRGGVDVSWRVHRERRFVAARATARAPAAPRAPEMALDLAIPCDAP